MYVCMYVRMYVPSINWSKFINKNRLKWLLAIHLTLKVAELNNISRLYPNRFLIILHRYLTGLEQVFHDFPGLQYYFSSNIQHICTKILLACTQ